MGLLQRTPGQVPNSTAQTPKPASVQHANRIEPNYSNDEQGVLKMNQANIAQMSMGHPQQSHSNQMRPIPSNIPLPNQPNVSQPMSVQVS